MRREAHGGAEGLGDMPLFVDELVPADSMFVLNPDYLWRDRDPSPTFFASSSVSTPLHEDTLLDAMRAAAVEKRQPYVMVMGRRAYRRLRRHLAVPRHGWPVDVEGAMRCPTCFRRLRKSSWRDARECPSRRCPLGPYVVDGVSLAEWPHRND